MYWVATRSFIHHGTSYSWTPRDIPVPPEDVPVVVPADAELLIREAVSSLLAQLSEDFVIPPHASLFLPIPAPEIDQIDREVRRLRSAMLAVTREFGQRITSLSQKRNSLAVFGRLPLELSGIILRHSLDVPEEKYGHRRGSMRVERLKELACVSSAWWCVVKSYPTLWTTIDISDCDVEDIALKLRKSGALPLTISGAWNEDSASKNFDVVTSHCHRWGSAKIQLDQDLLHLICRRLETPMPLLESLILIRAENCGRDDWSERDIETLVVSGSDSFHTLELDSAMPHQDSPVLKTVRKLQIRNPRVSDILAMLTSTTQLESLDLSGIGGEGLEGHIGTGIYTVHLPKLQSLELTGLTSLAVIGLIDGIRCESLTMLRISLDDEDNTHQLLGLLMDSQRPILTSITPHMKAVKFQIWNDDMLEITGESGDSRHLYVSLLVRGLTEWFSTTDCFRGFASHLPDTEIVLDDDSGPADSALAPWNLRFLLEMPSVVSMEVASHRRLIREVFTNILGKPHGACPRLTAISIPSLGLEQEDWKAVCALMEDALRARKEANPTLPTIVVDTEREVPSGGYIICID